MMAGVKVKPILHTPLVTNNCYHSAFTYKVVRSPKMETGAIILTSIYIFFIHYILNTFNSLIQLAAHLHHAGVHVHLVQRESLLCLVGSHLPTQGFHVTVELPLEVLERRLFDVFHQNVVLGFDLEGGP